MNEERIREIVREELEKASEKRLDCLAIRTIGIGMNDAGVKDIARQIHDQSIELRND